MILQPSLHNHPQLFKHDVWLARARTQLKPIAYGLVWGLLFGPMLVLVSVGVQVLVSAPVGDYDFTP